MLGTHVDALLYLFLGVVSGVIAGILPGLHPNTIAILGREIRKFIGSDLSFLVFMISMGVVDAIVNFIPAIFLGAPEEESSVAMLPGHKLLLQGYGKSAVKLCLIGSLLSMLICVLALPLLLFLIPLAYEIAKSCMWFLLLIAVVISILKERERKLALFCFLLSGVFGVLLKGFPIDERFSLFPVLTGLFGLPSLVLAIKSESEIPEQKERKLKISNTTILINSLLGSAAGILVGVLPGIGPAQAITLLSFRRSAIGFLIASGAIAVSNFMFSIASLYLIGKARNGVAIAIRNEMEFGIVEMLTSICISIAACGIAVLVSLYLIRFISTLLRRVNYKSVNLITLFFLLVMIFCLTSFEGLFLAFVSFFIGLYTWLSPVRKSNLMGVLILPSILYYLGV